MKFGLFANVTRRGARGAIDKFIEWTHESGNEVVLSDDLQDFARDHVTFAPRKELAAQVDIVVSMGGDGTLLATSRDVGASGKPILGINLGSLGFLTQLTPKQLVPALEKICQGDYQIEERMLLKAQVNGSQELSYPYALNDIVIDKGAVSRLIEVHFRVNGEDIVTYRADGIVISTPTGSTAHSLAVGGPIMHPKMKGIIAAPISSFSLSTRPMLFDAEDVLELTIRSHDRVVGLTLDGQVMISLFETARVTISQAEHSMRFIVFPENSFYKVLRNKLHWGRPPRTGG